MNSTEATPETESVDEICGRIASVALVDCYLGIGFGFGVFAFGLAVVIALRFLAQSASASSVMLAALGGGLFFPAVSAVVAGLWGFICCGLTVLVSKALNLVMHPLRIACTAGGLTACTMMYPTFLSFGYVVYALIAFVLTAFAMAATQILSLIHI